jgi:lysozyme family protein
MDLNKLKQLNAKRWDSCHIYDDKGPKFNKVAQVLTANQGRYQGVATVLAKQGYNVPWYFIAVAHYREAGFDKSGQPIWSSYLGNGQPWNKKTTITPKGRGPFTSWEEGAIDALMNAAPYAAKNRDWSIGGTLTMLEEYNGLGYAGMDKPSPYIWAGTDQYAQGKYIADGKYNASVVDQQLGCAGILKFMGVFKTAPTGSATVVVGAGAAAATAAAATNQSWWDWALLHWPAVAVTVFGVAFFTDLLFAIYNNEKNRLVVTTTTAPAIQVNDVANTKK